MASALTTLSAARKLANVRAVPWPDGPVCRSGPGDERKVWEIELSDLLVLVAAVERKAPSTPVAAQWLRRMFYSTPLGGAGAGFDQFILTDPVRKSFPMTTDDVPQSILDALIRVGSVRIPRVAEPFNLVEISHVFVLLDLTLNGASPDGRQFQSLTSHTGPGLAPLLSWAGDLGSAWLGYQDTMEKEKTAAGAMWTEPVATRADLAFPLLWLENGISGRAPLDDLLGDMDAVVLSNTALRVSPTPIATLLSDYYTVGQPTTIGTPRVDDRFPLWLDRIHSSIPLVDGAARLTLGPGARDWIRRQIYWAVFALLARARGFTKLAAILNHEVKVKNLELDEIPWTAAVGAAATAQLLEYLSRPWNSAMIDELADRFHTFLADGLAGSAPTWPSQPPKAVDYPGYEWTPQRALGVPVVQTLVPELNDLEALAQFHLNWRQPHCPLRDDRLLRPLQLRNPSGRTATVVGGGAPGKTRLQLDEFVDLRDVVPSPAGDHADLLRLDGDSARASKTYRIVEADLATRTLTVDGVPSLAAPSEWKVIRRPRLLLIDPFGARMSGYAASTVGVPDGWVALDGTPDLDRMRANFDMIMLDADVGPASRVYRIMSVHPTEPWVQLDGVFKPFKGSVWQVPAGVAREVISLASALTPTAEGCDTYDGMLFVVYGDAVQGPPLPVTSYSSTANAADPVFGSSITGNARYSVRSMRSPNAADAADARNFEFAVTDPDTGDAVKLCAFYQDGVTALRRPPPSARVTAPLDADGKVNIRIHTGNSTGSVAGSTGDLVSPSYPALRTLLISLHQAERALLGLTADVSLATIGAATTQNDSVALYNGGSIGDSQWNERLRCELILVRPDLRSTAP